MPYNIKDHIGGLGIGLLSDSTKRRSTHQLIQFHRKLWKKLLPDIPEANELTLK